jgi:hypothetical protein
MHAESEIPAKFTQPSTRSPDERKSVDDEQRNEKANPNRD